MPARTGMVSCSGAWSSWLATASEEANMFAAQAASQNLESIQAVTLLLAAGLVIFWRAVIKLMIMVVAITVIALLGAGVFVLLQALH